MIKILGRLSGGMDCAEDGWLLNGCERRAIKETTLELKTINQNGIEREKYRRK